MRPLSCCYFTLILILAFLPLYVFTVMVAWPFFFAVTFPVGETVATDFLLEVKVSLLLAVFFGSFTLIW